MTPIEVQDIIQSINSISFNHEDLMAVVLDFSDGYFELNKDRLSPYFDNPSFLQQSVLCVREALVLGVNGLILSEKVPFSDVLDGCINYDAQSYHLEGIGANLGLKKEIISFWNSLRKDVFTNLYNENKEMIKITNLLPNLLEERFQLFINKFSV